MIENLHFGFLININYIFERFWFDTTCRYRFKTKRYCVVCHHFCCIPAADDKADLLITWLTMPPIKSGQGTSQQVHSLVSIQQEKSFHWSVHSAKRSLLIGQYRAPRDRVLVSHTLLIVSLFTHTHSSMIDISVLSGIHCLLYGSNDF